LVWSPFGITSRLLPPVVLRAMTQCHWNDGCLRAASETYKTHLSTTLGRCCFIQTKELTFKQERHCSGMTKGLRLYGRLQYTNSTTSRPPNHVAVARRKPIPQPELPSWGLEVHTTQGKDKIFFSYSILLPHNQ
jgi:hypothetical protein